MKTISHSVRNLDFSIQRKHDTFAFNMFLLYILIFFLIVRLLFRYVLPRLLPYFLKRFLKKHGQEFEQFTENRQPAPEAPIKMETPKKPKANDDDYIDFEEIK